jgi:hypothetical protein
LPVGVPAACCAGEIHELKEELASLDRPKKKEAVKKVIAAMTVGKDVSMLFPHVVNCMQTEDLELKKLVYLYLINYAKTQPDLAIMAVNTFVKVTKHSATAAPLQAYWLAATQCLHWHRSIQRSQYAVCRFVCRTLKSLTR